MAKKPNENSKRDVAEKANTPLARNLSDLIGRDVSKMAEYLTCSPQAIIQYKQGTAVPQVEKLIKIAEYFNVSTDYLLGLSNVKSTDTELKGVCEYTGLTEKAVAVLKNLNSAAVGSGIDSDVDNNGRQAKGLIISSIDLPINILNMLLENVHLLSMVYSYLVLTSDIGENNNVYIGDRANSVLFEIALEMRKIRDSFQLEYTKIFKTLKEKDSANNGEHTGKTE